MFVCSLEQGSIGMAGKGFLQMLTHHGAGILLALGLMGAAGAQAVTVKVTPDTAKLVNVAGKPATLIVGNPAYADVAAIEDKVLVQGRNYGKTNVIVLDKEGRRLAQFDVVVTPGQPEEMTLFRDGKRTTYLCAPDCAQMMDTRDDYDEFRRTTSRIESRAGAIRLFMDK